MNLIIIDKKDVHIKSDSSSIIVDSQKIPFRLIDTLLIVGKQKVNTYDLTKISSQGIQILLLSHNYKDSAIITATSGKSAELKLAQYKAPALPIAKMILKKKILSHEEQLRSHQISINTEPFLKKIKEAREVESLLGIEGSFSKLYFAHFFKLFPKSLHKSKRSKRPPLDPLNALLSLYYTLFYNIIAIRLIAYGFETGIGFLHRPFRSHHALSSDLLEIFRAQINEFVYEIFANKRVTLSDFTNKRGVYLKQQGRRALWIHFKEFSQTLIPKIDDEIAQLRKAL